MSNVTAFQNRVLETRDPNHLIVINTAWLKQHPEHKDVALKYYDKRGDLPLDQTFKNQVAQTGAIHTPLFIAEVPEIGTVVIAGRQRKLAAQSLGFKEVPVIEHDPDVELSLELELTENIARRESSVLENAFLFKKFLASGISMAKLATLAGCSEVQVLNTIMIGEMPSFVHQAIEKGTLSPTAALQFKSFGKKAAKGSGVSKVYDKEAETAIKTAMEGMDAETRLTGKKPTVKQARSSTPKHVDTFTGKEWDALVADEQTPVVYALLIQVFRSKLSWQEARRQGGGELDWLRRLVPQPKPKKEKKAKAKVTTSETPAKEESDEDLMRSMFQ